MTSFRYYDSGVYCNPSSIEKGKKVKITYEGILAKDGADKVYAHVGFGSDDKWSGNSLYEMDKVRDNKFETEILVTNKGDLNIAFKDSADHWDNNNSKNYTFKCNGK
ncbi:carbohydrate-binding protein [Xylanivirga thermophila]|jgi:hypothetical protein|uniref:carbohydrate-binding protein n=1 Tax=Xylanivirga thermophila TaxID=2496273 RepID=UPI00101C5D98|nr:carbohydrate-binding protein [Xylanivirga thermophila]